MTHITLGKYKHYKGTIATVIGIAEHTETGEIFVVYTHFKSETGNDTLWVRPLKMFTENVTIQGKQIPRFTYIEE
jgi:hypothetical protein